MLLRAAALWAVILLLASINGGARDLILAPRLGDTLARAISTVVLCGLVILVAWLGIGWIRPRSTGEAIAVGLLWLALTLAFEFLAGHYLFKKPWATLLEDYDVRRGRIWAAVLVVTLFAPLWAARARDLLPPGSGAQ